MVIILIQEEEKLFLTSKIDQVFKTVVIDEIPKNDAGKTLYKELEKYYL